MIQHRMSSYSEDFNEIGTYSAAKETPHAKVRLNLSAKRITKLPSNILGLEHIDYLEVDLSYNDYTIDSKLVFSKLAKLENLRGIGFMYNKFSGFDVYPDGFSELESLDLSGNQTLKIDESFRCFRKLKFLKISSCRLNGFPDVVTELENLEVLIVNDNDLETLPVSISRLKKLRILGLKGNRIKSLPKELLTLEQLESLDISHNSFSELPAGLGQLRLLKDCLFSHNDIVLEEAIDVLSELPSLKRLDLSNNGLSTLPSSVQKIRHLEFLDISHNELTDLPVFQDVLQSLSEIKADDNPGLTLKSYLKFISQFPGFKELLIPQSFTCDQIPDEIGACHALISIEIPSGIVRISEKMFDLPNLESIKFASDYSVSEETVMKVPDLFDRLKTLKSLDIYYCKRLKELPESVYRCLSLEYLSSFRTEFKLDIKKMSGLTNLRTLQIPVEKQEELEEISKLSNLERLYLSSEAVELLPESFVNLTRLTEFGFSDLKNLNVEDALGKLPFLESFSLYRGKPRNLAGYLKKLVHLRRIFIANSGYFYNHNEMLDVVEQLPLLNELEYRTEDTYLPGRMTLLNKLEKCTIHDGHFSYQDNSEIDYDLNIAGLDLKRVVFHGSLRFTELRKILKKVNSYYFKTPFQKIMALGFFSGKFEQIKEHLSNPFKEDLSGVVLYMCGKPTLGKAKELTENMVGRGARILKKLDNSVTHILVSSQFKENELVEILKSEKPIVPEDYFKDQVFAEGTPYLMDEGSDEMTSQITRLLRAEGEDNTALVLELIEGGGANKAILSYLFSIHLFHGDVEIRKKSRGLFKKFAPGGLQSYLKNVWKESLRKKEIYDPVLLALFVHEDIDFFDSLFAFKMLRFHSGVRQDFSSFSVRGVPIHVLTKNFEKLDFIENLLFDGLGKFDFKTSFEHIRNLKLKSFILMNYELDEFPAELFHFKTITSININYGHNAIDKVLTIPKLPENQSLLSLHFANFEPIGFENFRSVTEKLNELNLRNCQLKHFPNFIGHSKDLTKLSLIQNRFTEVNFDFGLLPQLKELLITDSPITTFSDTFWNSKRLQTVMVKNAKITEFPLSLFMLQQQSDHHRTAINFSGNEISTLEFPSALQNKPILHRFTNFLSRSGKMNGYNDQDLRMSIIGLGRNKFKEVPEVLGQLNIESLGLSGNPIRHLSVKSIANVKRRVDLENTLIEDIPVELFDLSADIRISNEKSRINLPDPAEIPSYSGRKAFYFAGMTDEDRLKIEEITSKQVVK